MKNSRLTFFWMRFKKMKRYTNITLQLFKMQSHSKFKSNILPNKLKNGIIYITKDNNVDPKLYDLEFKKFCQNMTKKYDPCFKKRGWEMQINKLTGKNRNDKYYKNPELFGNRKFKSEKDVARAMGYLQDKVCNTTDTSDVNEAEPESDGDEEQEEEEEEEAEEESDGEDSDEDLDDEFKPGDSVLVQDTLNGIFRGYSDTHVCYCYIRFESGVERHIHLDNVKLN